jgi:hypothetical protein
MSGVQSRRQIYNHFARREIDCPNNVLQGRDEQFATVPLHDVDVITASFKDVADSTESSTFHGLDGQPDHLVPVETTIRERHCIGHRHVEECATERESSVAIVDASELQYEPPAVQPMALNLPRDRGIADEQLWGALEAFRKVGVKLADELSDYTVDTDDSGDGEQAGRLRRSRRRRRRSARRRGLRPP